MPGKPIVPKKPLIKGTPQIVVDPKIKDDVMLRTMPITQSQLKKIKKHYGM